MPTRIQHMGGGGLADFERTASALYEGGITTDCRCECREDEGVFSLLIVVNMSCCYVASISVLRFGQSGRVRVIPKSSHALASTVRDRPSTTI